MLFRSRDIGRIATGPLQAAAVERDAARAEIARGVEIDQAAVDCRAARVSICGRQRQRPGACLGETPAAGIGTGAAATSLVGDDIRDDLVLPGRRIEGQRPVTLQEHTGAEGRAIACADAASPAADAAATDNVRIIIIIII